MRTTQEGEEWEGEREGKEWEVDEEQKGYMLVTCSKPYFHKCIHLHLMCNIPNIYIYKFIRTCLQLLIVKDHVLLCMY